MERGKLFPNLHIFFDFNVKGIKVMNTVHTCREKAACIFIVLFPFPPLSLLLRGTETHVGI